MKIANITVRVDFAILQGIYRSQFQKYGAKTTVAMDRTFDGVPLSKSLPFFGVPVSRISSWGATQEGHRSVISPQLGVPLSA